MRRLITTLALGLVGSIAMAAELVPYGLRSAPLLEGMGAYHHGITTDSPLAQRYFDQGLVLAYGFNHKEAARSFRQAQYLDAECAMCFWGEALVLGPNINAKMDPADNPDASAALQRALALRGRASERERAYIDALARRYAPDAPAERGALDHAYTEAMREVARRFPEDADAQTLYTEALMDTMPWDYWEPNGKPKPATRTIISTLEDVLARYPNHPGANHLLIHAVEKVQPRRAIAAADRLRDLVPNAGHLQHMPSHIYIRVGRYHDAVIANEKGIAADNAYIAQCHAQGVYPIGYVPHNHHFLAAATSFIGMSARAIEAARHIAAHQDQQLMRQPGYEGLQHYLAMPLYAYVRFGRWSDIRDTPAPTDDLSYVLGVWHYARGLMFVRHGELAGAKTELAALGALTEDVSLDAAKIWDNNSMAQVLRIARAVLAGEIAHARGDKQGTLRFLREAVKLEEALAYQEPSDWFVPARHHLGAVLLEVGRAREAEQVYRADLASYPDNGWSLYGLARSLRAQRRLREANAVETRFRKVWAKADIELTASRF